VIVEDMQIPIHSPMSVEQAFYLITRAGALSLRRPDLGAIFVGAKADLIVFDGESPGMLGFHDPVAAVILHSNVGDIEHVVVNGEFVKKNGRLVYDGYNDVKRNFLKSARRLQDIWLGLDWGSWSEGLFSGTTEYAEPVQIDTLSGEGTGY
jgi:cytosine/adenosine deaminase-related metal-dependent hydrolase